MSMMSTVLAPEPARIILSANITANFVAVGPPLKRQSRIIRIVNLTDQPIYYSVDGTNPAGAVDKASTATIDLCAAQALSAGAVLAARTQFYVRAPFSLPSAGSAVVIESYAGVRQ